MEIHFQTTDHVVAVEKVAEQHIATKYSRTSVIRPSIIRISGLTELKSCLPTYKTRSSVSDNTRFYIVSETMKSSAL